MLLYFILFASAVLARQLTIEPQKSFSFLEQVDRDNLFKFIYSTKGSPVVTIRGPEGEDVFTATAQNSTLYTKSVPGGRFKITIENKSSESMVFNYKCPDPNKEMQGHLGYVKDTDLVNDLARVLDDLVVGQEKNLERTFEHQQMVSRSRSWAKYVLSIEFILTAAIVYYLHKDFIRMFEQKQ